MNAKSARLSVFGVFLAAVVALAGCTATTSATGTRSEAPTSASASAATPSPTATTKPKPKPKPKPVHVSLLEGDGSVFGVGMPIIAYFDVKPTDATAFVNATKVTVNGQDAHGAWYFEGSGRQGSALEGHYRLVNYWPAHAQIHMDLPVHGLSAGKGLVYDDSLTLDMSTGARHVSTVDAHMLKMTVTSDGKVAKSIPVSLGKASTPTYKGVKVIMEKDRNERMIGPGYNEIVPWSLRVTNSGEFVHAAAWNSHIGQTSTSNGCTNLNTADAIWMYQFSLIGDVVLYPNAPGQTMPSWDGYGDWNLSWSQWHTGGALKTS